MELYVRVQDSHPFGDPISGDTLRQTFPEANAVRLPAGFAYLVPAKKPNACGEFEVEEATYQWIDGGTAKQIWHVRPMTSEERAHARKAKS